MPKTYEEILKGKEVKAIPKKGGDINQWREGITGIIEDILEIVKTLNSDVEKLKKNQITKAELSRTLDERIDSLRNIWGADLPEIHGRIDKYNSELRTFQQTFEKANERANQLLIQHEELLQKIQEVTPLEQEIIKLKADSDEWSLFRGYAVKKKGKRSQEFQLPFMLCPQCCRPTEEVDVGADEITLIYRPVQREQQYARNEYYLIHPDEYSEPPILQRKITIPIALWNRCKTIKHADWHDKYMRRTDDDYGIIIEPYSPEIAEKNITKKFRTDNFDDWFDDIWDNYPTTERPSKRMDFKPFCKWVYGRVEDFSFDDLKEKLKELKITSPATRAKYIRVLEKVGVIEPYVKRNERYWHVVMKTK